MDDFAVINLEEVFSTLVLDEEFDEEIDSLEEFGLSSTLSKTPQYSNF